jgi:NAD(P)-dependent dehydrogenase (short-subunit alcohol dehydrogenase family)
VDGKHPQDHRTAGIAVMDSTISLENKIAVVTGAGRGIGHAIALRLARFGAHVVVSDIDLERINACAYQVEELGQQSLAITANVADEDQVQNMIRQAVERFARIDILVNNAGVVSTGPLADTTSEVWDRTLAINLKGVFLCTKAVFPHMMAQRDGRIVNIASVAGKRGGGLHGNACYAASKGGVIAFTKSIAREGGPYNIRVNAIAPALIETDMLRDLPSARLAAILESVPLRRMGKTEDVAAAVCFLASDAASFMTGEIMDVDGGLMMD